MEFLFYVAGAFVLYFMYKGYKEDGTKNKDVNYTPPTESTNKEKLSREELKSMGVRRNNEWTPDEDTEYKESFSDDEASITITLDGVFFNIRTDIQNKPYILRRMDIITDSIEIMSDTKNQETFESRKYTLVTSFRSIAEVSTLSEKDLEDIDLIIAHFVREKMHEDFHEVFLLNKKAMELEQEKKIDEAIEVYEEVIALEFEGNHPYDRLAILYRKRKLYDEEIRVLNTAILVFKSSKVSDSRADKYPKIIKFQDRLLRATELKNKLDMKGIK